MPHIITKATIIAAATAYSFTLVLILSLSSAYFIISYYLVFNFHTIVGSRLGPLSDELRFVRVSDPEQCSRHRVTMHATLLGQLSLHAPLWQNNYLLSYHIINFFSYLCSLLHTFDICRCVCFII